MSNERKITRVQHFNTKWKLKVAVYCRVSTTHDEQLESLSNQIDYYKAYVRKHLDWELVEIYSDIKSGKNSSGRQEFQRMLEDCKNKKIDLIVTKSISRFGRNTADTLKVINELRHLIIDVFFEVENIRLSESSKAFLISVIEAVAQAESEARSQNIKWGINRGLENGTSKLYNRICYGYYNDSEGNILINEKEAEIVRKIFELYLNGYSILAIIREFQKEGLKSPTGKESWPKRTIETILDNDKYIGNSTVRKTYTKDFPNNDRCTNKGKFKKYQAHGTHPAIVPEDLFEMVQQERLLRSNITRGENESSTRKSTHYSMKSSSDNGKLS